jgi:hypothetical protein
LGREKLNPYLTAGADVARRLAWDIRLESWRSRTKLKKLKDKYAGQASVILCNGPSLNRTDFGLLKDVYTFGLNKIHLLFPRTDFRPSSIVAVNRHVIGQTAGFYNETNIPLFLAAVGLRKVRPSPSKIFLHTTDARRRFSRDCSFSLYEGNTVTFVAMQLAFHMGFHRVALIGCDHNFAAKGPANKLVQGGESDPDHFDPNYFAGVSWQLPDLFESEVGYKLALDAYTASGRSLVNATDGGKLELLPRQTLAAFLGR